jgi:large subunit ribosomal protein L4
MPKKMRRLAMRCGLSSRHAEGAILALDQFVMSEPRTRAVAEAFRKLGVQGDVLIVDERFDANASLSARNLPNVEMRDAASLNLIDVLRPERLLFTRAALEAVDRRLSTPQSVEVK